MAPTWAGPGLLEFLFGILVYMDFNSFFWSDRFVPREMWRSQVVMTIEVIA